MAINTTIRKILLVDDDHDDCFFFEEQLKAIDPSLKLVCINEAKHLFLHAKELKPDLIFLDIDMPSLNGFRCLSQLRENEDLKSIPVVMYSSSFQPKDIEKAYLYGANLYVTKPSSLADIEATLKGILELDWSQPLKVTADYFPEGKYKRFKASK
jgi:PleD family two-component response regulator